VISQISDAGSLGKLREGFEAPDRREDAQLEVRWAQSLIPNDFEDRARTLAGAC
jgi:hypothetical protein